MSCSESITKAPIWYLLAVSATSHHIISRIMKPTSILSRASEHSHWIWQQGQKSFSQVPELSRHCLNTYFRFNKIGFCLFFPIAALLILEQELTAWQEGKTRFLEVLGKTQEALVLGPLACPSGTASASSLCCPSPSLPLCCTSHTTLSVKPFCHLVRKSGNVVLRSPLNPGWLTYY